MHGDVGTSTVQGQPVLTEPISAVRAARRACRLDLACAVLLGISAVAPAEAGGSAETTLLVVNAASPLSQRIANEYQRLRHVPDTHVVHLSGVPAGGELSVAEFREKVWAPIRGYLREHGLEDEIDLVTYAGEFPYRVDFSADAKASKLPVSPYRGTMASLTSMTYFAHRVEAGGVGYLGVNHYFREFAGPSRRPSSNSSAADGLSAKELRALRRNADAVLGRNGLARSRAGRGDAPGAMEALTSAVDAGWTQSERTRSEAEFASLRELPVFGQLLERMNGAYGPFMSPHGFRNGYAWSNTDLRLWKPADHLDRYYLSTLLAYTGIRGNSFPEIAAYLGSAAASDGTSPDGTVYLMENPNVRSETRQPLFQATVSELARRGRRTEILRRSQGGQDGIVPVRRDDVIGVVVGAQQFDWGKSNSRMLPGTVAESLTSYGGDFDNPSQTKLSALLRSGAAGSSGAVQEPYAIQDKFPVPLLHVHYTDGCSLAEAFYQSVRVPYQLVVVGDPLARPFARFAKVGLTAPDVAVPWSGTVRLEPAVKAAEGTAVGIVELWVDGERVGSAGVGEAIPWDTRSVEDGSHDLRLVAVEDSTIETRSVYRAQVRVFNRNRRIHLDEVASDVEYGQPIVLRGRAEGAGRVELRRGHRVLATADVAQGRWSVTVPSTAVGLGEPTVLVRAVNRDGEGVRSDPLPIAVREPAQLPASTVEKPAGEGLLAVVEDEAGNAHERVVSRLTGSSRDLAPAGVKTRKVKLSGFVRVGEAGTYHLAVSTAGRVRLSLHDRVVVDGVGAAGGGSVFGVVGLEAGWHPIEIELTPVGKRVVLNVVLGGAQAPAALTKEHLGHRRDRTGDRG